MEFENVMGFMGFNNHTEYYYGAMKELRNAKAFIEMKSIDSMNNGVYFVDTKEGRYLYTGKKWYEPIAGKMNMNAIVYDVRKEIAGEEPEVALEEVW